MNTTSNSTPFLTWTSTPFFKFNAILLCVVNVGFTFVGILLNSVVIVSLLNSQLRNKLCYFMILILSCFDLVVVVVFHPLIIVETILCWLFMSCSKSIEVPYEYVIQLFVFSLTALLIMTLERYLASIYPFFHEKFVTKLRLMVAYLLSQLPFCIIYVLFSIIWPDNALIVELAIILALNLVIFIVICALNFKLFHFVRTLRKRADIPLGNLDGSEETNIKGKQSKATLASLKKISTCLLAVVCLFVCHCPTIITIGLSLNGQTENWSKQTVRIVQLWTKTFITLNSSLNCLIFFYRNSILRRHGEKMLEKCLCARCRLHE